jgi:hypothetical protein
LNYYVLLKILGYFNELGLLGGILDNIVEDTWLSSLG